MLTPQVINNYVFLNYPAWGSWDNIKPFFPVHDSLGTDAGWQQKPYIVYDWITMRTPTDLYPIKQEQLIYTIRGTIDQIYPIRDKVIDLLDDQVVSAQTLNEWQRIQQFSNCISFHTIRAWQSGRVLEPYQTIQYYSLPMIIELSKS